MGSIYVKLLVSYWIHPRAVNKWLWSWTTTNIELLRWKMTSSASHRFSSSLSILACSRRLISLPLFSSTGYKVGLSVKKDISSSDMCETIQGLGRGEESERSDVSHVQYFNVQYSSVFFWLIKKKKKLKTLPAPSANSQCFLHLYWAVVNWEVAVPDQELKEMRRRRMRA